jgi:hypothetical protein
MPDSKPVQGRQAADCDNLKDSEVVLQSTNHSRRIAITICSICLYAIVVHSLTPPPLYQQRISDLKAIESALNGYHSLNGKYPGSQFVSAYSGGSYQEDWIPGIVPRFINKLPLDPRGEINPAHQYMYISDGIDYKLIAHGPEDVGQVEKILPSLMDPRRPTWAYGFWTKGAAKW